jgi:hypothetical protein
MVISFLNRCISEQQENAFCLGACFILAHVVQSGLNMLSPGKYSAEPEKEACANE